MRTNRIIGSYKLSGECVLNVVEGDITMENVDAIVNAANSHLMHGGGVARAIVDRGGYVIQKESNEIGYVPVGNVAVTSGGMLKAKYVIHAVGPRWGEGDEENKLYNAFYNSLKEADELNLNSISLPAISAGIFGYPKEDCARVFCRAVKSYMKENNSNLKEIRICLYGNSMATLFNKIISDCIK